MRIWLITAAVAFLPSIAHAQQGPASAQELADAIVSAYAGRDTAAFDRLVADPVSRRAARGALAFRTGVGDTAFVLEDDGRRALLLVAAHPSGGNHGDETIYARRFSGVYVAERAAAGWRALRRLPVDEGNAILSHHMRVDVAPGERLSVVDSMQVEIGAATGFQAHLVHAARLDRVELDGEPADHVFAGGLLWVRTPPRGPATLVVDYELDLAGDTVGGSNSGRFTAAYGHVRNQYFWHPFFGFDSQNDRAHFDVDARIPADYALVTSVPQRDSVAGDVRRVRARTDQPTFALTLLYDRAWRPIRRDLGGLLVEVFVTPEFQPGSDSIARIVERTHGLLSARFGAPAAGYLAVAQGRARSSVGWHFRSNALIVGGAESGPPGRGGDRPRAWFGHEVAHGWTHPTGPGSNFLSEGWATWVEALLVAEEYGAPDERRFWDSQTVWYFRDFDGGTSLVEDRDNIGVSYPKGAWVLRMLEGHVGTAAFDRGMRAYMAIPPERGNDASAFVRTMSEAAGRDLRPFLEPWLTERHAPELHATIEPGRVVLEQRGPLPGFVLPVELELHTATDTLRRTLVLDSRADTLDTRALGDVRRVLVDPDRRLLLKRTRGEVVVFELAVDADTVQLGGEFTGPAIPAERGPDGVWRAEVPLAEGSYAYWWLIDGRRVDAHDAVAAVRPLVELPQGRPRTP